MALDSRLINLWLLVWLHFVALGHAESTTMKLGQPPTGCNGDPIVLTSPQGYITSPGFNGSEHYRPRLDCEWILHGTQGKVFYFTFHELDLDLPGACTDDWLSIYDMVSNGEGLNTTKEDDVNTGSEGGQPSAWIDTHNLTEIARVCGWMLPYDVESNSSRVVLRFRTDAMYGGIGFNLSYSLQTPSVKCQDDEFQCGTSECIKYSLVCDGVPDCPDATDEVICATSTSCGHPAIQPVFPKIVGGSEVVEGAWPWTVSIVNSDGFVPNDHQCGATLIHPQWALTAAHCFEHVYSRVYEGYFIIGGRHQVQQPDKNEQIREFNEVFMNHNYQSDITKNDIALVRLKEPFNLTDYVNLACLPQEAAPVDHLCYITGWGETLDTCCANKLKQAGVPIVNYTICGSPDYYGSRLLDHMMCAGYPEGGVDTCQGDSGGPLVCESQSPGSRWEVQGVTSWGERCALPKRPGVYTAVIDYIKWIQQTIAHNTP